MVIQISLGSVRGKGGRKHPVDQLLSGGFAVASGYRDKGNIELVAVIQGKLLQRLQHIIHQNHRGSRVVRGVVNYRIGGTVVQRRFGKCIGIEVGAAQRKKKISLFQFPCIRSGLPTLSIAQRKPTVLLAWSSSRNLRVPGDSQ